MGFESLRRWYRVSHPRNTGRAPQNTLETQGRVTEIVENLQWDTMETPWFVSASGGPALEKSTTGARRRAGSRDLGERSFFPLVPPAPSTGQA